MASLTSCMKKAGTALRDEDRAAILARFNELTRGNTKAAEAARQAVDEQIAAVRALIGGGQAEAPVPDAAPAPKALSAAAVGQSFRSMVQEAREDLEGVLYNWQEAELSPDGERIVLRPGRDARFSKGKDGGKVGGSKGEFLAWLTSDAPFDPAVYGKDIGNDAEWRRQVEALRALVQTPAAPKSATPSANTIFTEDAAAAARARLKAKLGRLQSGIDPETLMDGITLAGYHIEKGARTFAAYARAMVDDLGDGVKPYLKSWYLGVAFDPRSEAFNDEMSSAGDVATLDVDAVLRKGVDAGLNKPAPDRVAMVAGLIANLPQRQALIEQGFDGLKVSDQRGVLAEMNARLQDDQVLNAVVESVPVDVVNVLMGRKLSTKALLNKPTMLMDRFAVALNAPIPAGMGEVIDSLVSFLSDEGALSAAEVASKTTDFGRATPRDNSAVKAGNRRHSVDGTSAQSDPQTTDSAASEKLAQATEKALAAGMAQGDIDAITEQPLFDGEPERAAELLDEAVAAMPEPAAPPTNDPFAGDYAALEGKMIEQTVTTDDGKTATLRMDAAVVMRDFDTREKTLEDLRLCLGRAA
jgi:hypothetical protein